MQALLTDITNLSKEQYQRLLLLACQNIAVKEGPNNTGISPDKYRMSVGEWLQKQSPTAPYCAAFYHYLLKESGLKPIVVSARARDYFSEKLGSFNPNALLQPMPKFGDAVGYSFGGNSKQINHIGMVWEWKKDDAYYYALEANTSALDAVKIAHRNIEREGGGVYIKKRIKSLALQITPIQNLIQS